jgi:Tfp pilus assembly protein PilO
MSSQFQQVVELMPAEANVADFMLQIREEATKAGARVKRLEPVAAVTKIDFYENRKLEIALEGSYAQILSFLSNLSKLKRLVTVEKLSLAQSAPGQQLSNDEALVNFTGTLVSYRYLAQSPTASPTPAPGGR